MSLTSLEGAVVDLLRLLDSGRSRLQARSGFGLLLEILSLALRLTKLSLDSIVSGILAEVVSDLIHVELDFVSTCW